MKTKEEKLKKQYEWVQKNLDHIKAYRHKWHQENKERRKKQRQARIKADKDWYKKAYEQSIPYIIIKNLTEPWYKVYKGIQCRCRPNGQYGKRGIRNFLSIKDIQKLWIRDKAHLMKKPSIDRIKTTGDYTFKNCRFIEWIENAKRPRASKGYYKTK